MPRIVKSAVRVLEVLELFDQQQRALTVGEIAQALAYPLSSTSILLRNLHDQEYLCYGPDQRSYLPTFRVTQLGAWVDPLLTPTSDVLAAMSDLSKRSGQTVVLGVPRRDQVQYVHVIPAPSSVYFQVEPGIMRPLVASNLGRLLLSALPDERIRDLVRRHKAGPFAAQLPLSLAALQRELASIRIRGHLLTLRGITPGVSSIGALLPIKLDGLPAAVTLTGEMKAIRDRQLEYVSLLREVIAHRFHV